jgi:hypothetical protein
MIAKLSSDEEKDKSKRLAREVKQDLDEKKNEK